MAKATITPKSEPAHQTNNTIPRLSSTLNPRLGQRYLGTEQLIFCAAPFYLATHGTPTNVNMLYEHQAICYGKSDGQLQPWHIQKQPYLPNKVFIIGSGEGLVQATVSDLGIAQLASWLIDEELAKGTLVPILPELNTTGLPIHLLWPRQRQLLPKVAAVLSHLTDGLSTSLKP